MPRKPNPHLIDDENPEWTGSTFGRARPGGDVLEELGIRKRGQRGPQKAPTKAQVTLRLDRDLLDYLRASGEGWQTRVNLALRRALMQGKHGRVVKTTKRSRTARGAATS